MLLERNNILYCYLLYHITVICYVTYKLKGKKPQETLILNKDITALVLLLSIAC